MRFLLAFSLLVLAACSPPATARYAARSDVQAQQQQPQSTFTPLPSPDVTGAQWVPSSTPHRIVYGKPGEMPLIALACEQNGPQAHLTLTRFALAPEDGKAVFAVDGNGYIGRWKADAAQASGGYVWQAVIGLDEYKLNALLGPRSIEASVPGAGTVIINQNELPRELVETCRSFTAPPLATGQPPPAR